MKKLPKLIIRKIQSAVKRRKLQSLDKEQTTIDWRLNENESHLLFSKPNLFNYKQSLLLYFESGKRVEHWTEYALLENEWIIDTADFDFFTFLAGQNLSVFLRVIKEANQ